MKRIWHDHDSDKGLSVLVREGAKGKTQYDANTTMFTAGMVFSG